MERRLASPEASHMGNAGFCYDPMINTSEGGAE